MDLPVNYNQLNYRQRKACREQYIKEQKGVCPHCGEPLSGPPAKRITDQPINWDLFPPNFTRYPVHLHHNHLTGMTISAVHAHCNAHLWQYSGI